MSIKDGVEARYEQITVKFGDKTALFTYPTGMTNDESTRVMN